MQREGPRVSTQPVALVTGIAGFCGSHLAEWLLAHGQLVSGIEMEGVPTGNLSAIYDQVVLHRADIRDLDQVRCIVAGIKPDRIYHLAGLTKPAANGDYRALYEVNVYGTINLLEAILAEGLDCSVLIAGSSAQYGLVAQEQNPVQETHPDLPVTHYALSKATQDLVGYRYWAATGLRVIRTRAFNIMGPRQSPSLVGSAFAKQVAEIERGSIVPRIEVGNLDARRDFVDVRDVVRAYWLALEQGKPGEAYNVCSGQARSIRSLLDGLLALSSIQGIQIRQDPARMQATDVPLQIGDYGRLQRQTSWRPEIPFEQTLQDLLDYWRAQVQEKLG
jgi:GDP-4-dehydro-6-deoxy-D-mannose reductase